MRLLRCVQSRDHWRCVLRGQRFTSTQSIRCAQSRLYGATHAGHLLKAHYAWWRKNQCKWMPMRCPRIVLDPEWLIFNSRCELAFTPALFWPESLAAKCQDIACSATTWPSPINSSRAVSKAVSTSVQPHESMYFDRRRYLENIRQSFIVFCRWLIKHPGFNYELSARDPSCLPKEYTNAEGTCYFLDGYKHQSITAEDAMLEDHINAAMLQITDDK